jgi:8-amino-7-oxononanoate synthase
VKELTIDHLPGRTIRHEGRDMLFFSGTAYLGMAQRPDFQTLLNEEIARHGTAFGSSRNGNLQLNIYDEAEARLANWIGAEAALTLSSGMGAGQAVVWLLRQHRARLHPAPGVHPALWDGPDFVLPVGPVGDWGRALVADAKVWGGSEPVALLVNALDAMQSVRYDFSWLADLPTNRLIWLVVDDSHGLGITGDAGSGIWRQMAHRPPNVRLIVTASLAKGMGLRGGGIFSDAATIAAIRQTTYFAASSPMSPVELVAFCRADALYADARIRLARNVARAETVLLPTGMFRQAADYPVFWTARHEIYPALLENDIFIYSFAYPTPADLRHTRVIVSALHEPADIDRLASVIMARR